MAYYFSILKSTKTPTAKPSLRKKAVKEETKEPEVNPEPNVLDLKVLELLKINDRKVIFASTGDRFLKAVEADIKKMNELHPDLPPVKVKIWEENGDLILGYSGGLLKLYKSSN
jgi:hypothetical protein